MELIQLSNVSKSYRQGGFFSAHHKITALEKIDLTLLKDQCTMIVGSSGSGKSTLGRLVLGIEQPDSGEVRYKGKSVARMNKEEYKCFRRNVQVVFQNSYDAVNPRFTAQQIIAEPLSNYTDLKREALKECIIQLLHKVGLTTGDLKKLPHQLSGGELQRVCIARALALSPELIILDEAVSSLDVLNQSRILELLATIKKETSFFFITHDLRIAGKFADALAIMQAGKFAFYAHNIQDKEVLDQLYKTPAFIELAQAIYPPLPPVSS